MAELAGIGQYSTVDPKFVRSAKAEADAIKNLGLTKEYIESRGGVNASGYYGDSWRADRNLTPEEYDAAIASAKSEGITAGEAINRATSKKNPSSGGGGSNTAGTKSTGSSSAAIYTASDGKTFSDQQAYVAYQSKLDQAKSQRQSAFDLLYEQFNQYGLGSLVTPLRNLIEQDVSPAEFTLKLRETDAYKKRFAANAARTAKGLAALSEADYINLEDRYQRVMRQYGLPESYYAKGELGAQPGFEKLIAADVRDDELADRLGTAYNRVINAAPEITTALKRFYPDITNGDILAYVLDPQKGLLEINRKVTAAEIGGAALGAGLATDMARAEELVGRGVTGAAAQEKYQTIGGGLKRGSELASIYQQPDYTQSIAEQEAFGLPSATEAQRKRKQLIGLETSTFGGRTGAGGALTRERAGQF
jgi:hypothetical protein